MYIYLTIYDQRRNVHRCQPRSLTSALSQAVEQRYWPGTGNSGMRIWRCSPPCFQNHRGGTEPLDLKVTWIPWMSGPPKTKTND